MVDLVGAESLPGGIIPADAGNGCFTKGLKSSGGNYLRLSGEESFVVVEGPSYKELSPPERRRALFWEGDSYPQGIISA